MGVEYSVVDDIGRVDEIWQEAYGVMKAKAARHIYTHSLSDFYYKKIKESEASLARMTCCSAVRRIFLSHTRSAWENG